MIRICWQIICNRQNVISKSSTLVFPLIAAHFKSYLKEGVEYIWYHLKIFFFCFSSEIKICLFHSFTWGKKRRGSTRFVWDRVYFLRSSWCGTMFFISTANSVDYKSYQKGKKKYHLNYKKGQMLTRKAILQVYHDERIQSSMWYLQNL